MAEPLRRVMFLYLGRRGLSRFALEAVRAAGDIDGVSASICVSRQNHDFVEFSQFGSAVIPVDTFAGNSGAILQAWRIGKLREEIASAIDRSKPDLVVELMPHVWSSFLSPVIRNTGVRYAMIVHDARPHLGDYRSAAANVLLDHALRQADILVTLSATVAKALHGHRAHRGKRVVSLFHPDIRLGIGPKRYAPKDGEPLRLMFLGRIMRYKGLPLFVDMSEELFRQGVPIQIGVFGEGDLGPNAARLAAMRAEVRNYWLDDAEIFDALSRYHAVVLSHLAASQSGVAAMALGAGIPVITTPVGGIIEQIEDEVTGVFAERADSASLSAAVLRLQRQPTLYQSMVDGIARNHYHRSMRHFVEQVLELCLAS